MASEKVEVPVNTDDLTKYPLDVLQKSLPDGVKPDQKHLHLSTEDFQTAFGMTLDEFLSKKDWKQRDLKKKVNLF